MNFSLIFFVMFAIFALIFLFSVIKIVPQGREFTVERFGKYTKTLTPGIHILTPFVERIGRRMNMMEQVLDVPTQEVITKDNAMVKVDAIVFIQVMDASAAASRICLTPSPSCARPICGPWSAPWIWTKSCSSATTSIHAC